VGVYEIGISAGTLAAANYRFEVVSGSLTVTPATPQITWPAPEPIEYGTLLGTAQLGAVGNTAGTFTYTPPVGTALERGTHTLTATFAADDVANWTAVTVATRAIEVVDTSAPRVTGLAPPTAAGGVSHDAVLRLTFGEPVFLGSGSVRIMNADGSLFESLAVGGRGAVSIAGQTVTITHALFMAGMSYHVLIEATCFRDVAGNAFPGIVDEAEWAFTTRPWLVTFAGGEHGTLVGCAPDVTVVVSQGAPAPAAPVVIPATGWSCVGWVPALPTMVTADTRTTALYERIVWTLAYTAGAHGSVTGVARQAAPHQTSGMPVTAVADFGYVFYQWSDDRTDNPRTDTEVVASVAVTASFRPAEGVAANGPFLAPLDAAGVAVGHGLWDMTGDYRTNLDGNLLILNMIHDVHGKLSGTATVYVTSGADVVPVVMPIRGRVRGTAGVLLATLALRGTDIARKVSVSLSFALALDAQARRLNGPVTGSIRTGAASTSIAQAVTLDLPASMDGTWTLLFELVEGDRGITGTALLNLSNGVGYAFVVRGKGRRDGYTAVLGLAGGPQDPVARSMRITTAIVTMESRQARLEAVSCTGYGQTLLW
jgi:hypothetical protein